MINSFEGFQILGLTEGPKNPLMIYTVLGEN